MKNSTYKNLAGALMLLYLFAWSVPTVHSQTAPRTLSYQGVLTLTPPPFQGGGRGVVGTYATGNRLLTVTLYGDANGTIKLWQSTMNATVDSNGVFNLMLGTADNPLPEPSVMDRPIWLGVAVDNAPELRPLSEVTASLYALNVVDNAITTNKLADNSVTTSKIADQSITSSKIADSSITASKLNVNYVGGLTVNGQSITGSGTNVNIVTGDGLNAVWVADQSSLLISGARGDTGNRADFVATGGVGTSPTCTGEPNTDGGPTNTISGGCSNNAMSSPTYATIGGGHRNKVNASWETIGGGDTNTATQYYSTVAGGYFNKAEGEQAAIGGGSFNYISTAGCTIAGGDSNTIDMGAFGPAQSFIGGGDSNQILNSASGEQSQSVIGGGYHNTIYEGASVIGGGSYNKISEEYASILGGLHNTDSEDLGVIAGGTYNKLLDPDVSIGLGDTVAGSSAIVAGAFNHILSGMNFMGGGLFNQITQGNYSAMGGGRTNTISADLSFIGTGDTNKILSDHGTIGGGRYNGISGPFGTIAGGDTNVISSGDHNAIGGGVANLINGSRGTIAGGDTNQILPGDGTARLDAIGGGLHNVINQSDTSFIGGGSHNLVSGDQLDVIGGGSSNLLGASLACTIGGGYDNRIIGADAPAIYSFIGGGFYNQILPGDKSVIAGGDSNLVIGNYTALAGGQNNSILSDFGFLGGGDSNTIDASSDRSFIGGGHSNWIQINCLRSAIVGGDSNVISNSGAPAGTKEVCSFIGAGRHNKIDANGFNVGVDSVVASAIVAGDANQANENGTFIGAGEVNSAMDDWDVVVGGHFNTAQEGICNAIVGGAGNSISPTGVSGGGAAFIGAGDTNAISGIGLAAAIPAGDHLTANEYAQTVLGAWNPNPPGNFHFGNSHVWSATNTQADDPILVIGNGRRGFNSDAFEVSYDGHSIVHDVNGNSSGVPTPRLPFVGSTYQDNTIAAWGDYAQAAGPFPMAAVHNADFGVTSVIEESNGVFLVTIANNGGTNYSNVSITVTIQDNTDYHISGGLCGYATCSEIGVGGGGPNTFVIRTYPGPFGGSCTTQGLPFFFKVVAR